jgi:hypothetical protein
LFGSWPTLPKVRPRFLQFVGELRGIERLDPVKKPYRQPGLICLQVPHHVPVTGGFDLGNLRLGLLNTILSNMIDAGGDDLLNRRGREGLRDGHQDHLPGIPTHP